MAIVKKGNLIGASGKVDNLIVSHWKGITYVKGLSYIRKNKRVSDKQQTQRNAFGAVNTFAKSYRYTLIRHVWNKLVHNMTGQNLFVSINIAAFNKGSESIDYSLLKISTGKIPLPMNMSAVIDATDKSILKISWKDFSDYQITRKNDLAHVFLLTKSGECRGVLHSSLSARIDGALSIDLHQDMIEKTLEVYLYFSDAKELNFSDSLWLEIE